MNSTMEITEEIDKLMAPNFTNSNSSSSSNKNHVMMNEVCCNSNSNNTNNRRMIMMTNSSKSSKCKNERCGKKRKSHFKNPLNSATSATTFGRPLLIGLVLCCLLNLCCGDVEPKLNSYEDATSGVITKSAGGLDDLNSINNNHNGGNNNNIHNESTKSSSSSSKSSSITDLGFIHAFIASISVIVVSELGDKTFFIAAIMAMRHPRLTVFIGAISALALMTILSAVFGMAATIIPRVYTYYISTALFAIFGIKMLKEGYYMSPTDAQEELEEVQSDLRKREDELMKTLRDNDDDTDMMSSTNSLRRSRRIVGNDDDTRIMDNNHLNRNHNHHNNIINNNNNDSDNNLDIDYIDKDDNDHNNDIQDDDNIDIDDDCRRNIRQGNQMQSVFKASSSSSSSCNINSDHDGTTVIVHKSNKALKLIPPKCGINVANGIELVQLNKGGCKNRLEKEVSSTLVVQDPESGIVRKSTKRSAAYIASRIFMQAFTMTFLAEWGDRSQLTTIILSAREDVYGVIVGGVLGHSLCTGLAVVGGRMIAQKISVRTVTLVGGVVFILFAISALFFNPNEEP